MNAIAVDVRMIRHSGIGAYIGGLLPRVIARLPESRFRLLGHGPHIEDLFRRVPSNVSIRECDAPIYSVREQLSLAAGIPPGTDLFWAPHYNIPLLHRGNLIVTVHDLFPLAMPRLVGGLHKVLYARAMFAAVKTKASAVICVSRFTAEELRRHAGVPPERITVIHNGVDPLPESALADPPPEVRPYILFVGNVKPNKNLGGLLDAFARIRDRVPHNLIVVGKTEGFLTGDDAALAEAGRFAGRIRFTGLVEADVLRRYYVHAEALVFPSFYEGFGFPPLEAMAAGCPVIASHAASLPEVCGDAALYCDPRDPGDMAIKILRILSDNPLRQDFRRKGGERVRLFSWERCADATADAIRRVLAPRREGPAQ